MSEGTVLLVVSQRVSGVKVRVCLLHASRRRTKSLRRYFKGSVRS